MRLIWKQILQSLTMGMIAPGLLLSAAVGFTDSNAVAFQEQPPAATQETEPLGSVDPVQPLYLPVLTADGTVVQMELEEYISRVVLGEVPASFDEEAIKAQAVAARTYTLRCIEDGYKHTDGAVCTDYRCCQAYREPEEYLQSGGTEKNVSKIYNAVKQTAGQVLYYEGDLIHATYFACSGGSTEDAQEVWGQAYPYLTAVSTPWDEDTAYYAEQVSYSAEEFQELLGVTLSGSPKDWFGNVYYTDGDGVDTMRIGAKLYSGVKLRSIFGLRSTIFTVSATEDTITFETKGYGHRVGLSQYGADAMAVLGNRYDEILAYYYPGTSLEQYQVNSD